MAPCTAGRSGTEFGACGEKHFRNWFATSTEILEMGLGRLKPALDDIKGFSR
jgi:bifunctional pyridoxal-dependent enzyme with beta-cystathionase and maltose regulon repressor activities